MALEVSTALSCFKAILKLRLHAQNSGRQGQLVTNHFLSVCVQSPSQALHYGNYPLNIVRGSGQYFYDENGEQYLDTTNNVAHGMT